MAKPATPKVEKKTLDEVTEIKASIEATELSAATKAFVISCIDLAMWVPLVLQRKNISLKRLKTMIFGDTRRKKKSSSNSGSGSSDPTNNPAATGPDQAADITTTATTDDSTPTKATRGHGRKGEDAYTADNHYYLETGYEVGGSCPLTECSGKLYPLSAGTTVHIVGQNMAEVNKYYVERLRCNLCGYLVKAELPANVAAGKYDASFKTQVALSKLQLGVPYYRLEAYQKHLGFPLPDATQWQLVEQLGGYCFGVFSSLQALAANGELIHVDDTPVRILSVIKTLQEATEQTRSGMYTSCFVGDHAGHRIILYFNGNQHAGENAQALLEQRAEDAAPILQMSDALAANFSHSIAVIMCLCLSHGFRKFNELMDYFPEECLPILKKLSAVFKLDKQTQAMDNDARLAFHQRHSRPIMLALYDEISTLLESKDVEPNGDLSAALCYMRKNWVGLTRFLTVAGAPICNNIVERTLKLAIRVRKSAMFYKTPYSARLSGVVMSLIVTCCEANENPATYLTALQENAAAVAQSPAAWLPWNYREALAQHSITEPIATKLITLPANPQGYHRQTVRAAAIAVARPLS